LPALEAVLEDVGRPGVDEIVVGGEVFPGPMSVEVFARLMGHKQPVRFTRDGDRVVVTAKWG
jgi:hypothetical protein